MLNETAGPTFCSSAEADEFFRRMQAFSEDDDTENGHCGADDHMVEILRRHGYGEGCDIFDAMYKWYA